MDFSLGNTFESKQNHEAESEQRVKVLILGSGPAGLSAGLYAARADLAPILLTGMELGGQVSLTYTVENYPGFPEGVGGMELVDLFQKHAERFGARAEMDSAMDVNFSTRPFAVKTQIGKHYRAESLIIATGASPNHLNIPGETELTGRGVSYCATCDGYFFKEKQVIVVGGGDSALEEGIFLTRFASSVTIVHRRDQLRAGAVLIERAMANPKINFIWNSVLTQISGEGTVNSVKLQNVNTGEVTERTVDGVFVFIGHSPNNQLFKGKLEMDDHGYIKVNQLMQTSVAGVFAAGEAADPNYRQVITSAGMGAAAAIQANRFLEEHPLD